MRSENAEIPNTIFEAVVETSQKHLDNVVIIAGHGLAGEVDGLSHEDAVVSFDTNLFGVLRVVRVLTPLMLK